MAKKKNIYVVTRPDGNWGVKREGNSRASNVTSTQKEAIEKGRNLAKENQSELLIQGKNSKFREKNSYGNDNFPPKG